MYALNLKEAIDKSTVHNDVDLISLGLHVYVSEIGLWRKHDTGWPKQSGISGKVEQQRFGAVPAANTHTFHQMHFLTNSSFVPSIMSCIHIAVP